MDAPSAAAVGRDVGSGCVPLYRPRYAYVHRVVSRAWLASGAVCTGLVGDGSPLRSHAFAPEVAAPQDDGSENSVLLHSDMAEAWTKTCPASTSRTRGNIF